MLTIQICNCYKQDKYLLIIFIKIYKNNLKIYKFILVKLVKIVYNNEYSLVRKLFLVLRYILKLEVELANDSSCDKC